MVPFKGCDYDKRTALMLACAEGHRELHRSFSCIDALFDFVLPESGRFKCFFI